MLLLVGWPSALRAVPGEPSGAARPRVRTALLSREPHEPPHRPLQPDPPRQSTAAQPHRDGRLVKHLHPEPRNPATPEGTTGPEHLALIENGSTDLLSFGRLFIANPDLPCRLAMSAPVGQPDMSRAYGGDETGYPPYPEEPDTRAS